MKGNTKLSLEEDSIIISSDELYCIIIKPVNDGMMDFTISDFYNNETEVYRANFYNVSLYRECRVYMWCTPDSKSTHGYDLLCDVDNDKERVIKPNKVFNKKQLLKM